MNLLVCAVVLAASKDTNGYIPATDSHYEPVRDVARTVTRALGTDDAPARAAPP